MVIVESYGVALVLCVITMLCWGSWANTQKLATREWAFQLFYWDYAAGVLLLSLVAALTLGSFGWVGRSFIWDVRQATGVALGSAFLGGVIFNLSNILLVAAIDIAGMAVAFPIGVGIALVLGVVTNYVASPVGSPWLLFSGVAAVVAAIVVDALAYRSLQREKAATPSLGIVVSVGAGVLMGLFYRFVAASLARDFASPEAGALTPYSAVVLFAAGLFLSTFVWNGLAMAKPLVGRPVPARDYVAKGTPALHLIGLLGGAIWGLGMTLSLVAAGAAGVAISYGLGQGATMIAAFWGVCVWREFRDAPARTTRLLVLMFALYIAGLGLIIAARNG